MRGRPSFTEEQDTNEYLHDAALVEEVRGGNRSLFGVLIRRYQNRLYNYLYRFAHNREGSEDLVSETFVRAYFQLDKCRDPYKFSPWLFAIAHNLGINHWKKMSRERERVISLENIKYEIADMGSLDAETAAANKEEHERVEKALSQLEEKYRFPLFLFYYEDFSYEEISEVLGIQLNTVKTHIFRAKKQLARKFTDQQGNGGLSGEKILARAVIKPES